MKNKLFTEKQIYTATFFGGPITAGILIYKNFKRIGDDQKANWTLMFTGIFTVSIFYGLMKLPEEITGKIPDIIFTSLYTFIVYTIYNNLLAEKINARIMDDDDEASNWTVAGFSVLGLLLNLIIIFAFAFAQPAFPGDKYEYGEMKHEIFYDSGEISQTDLQAIGRTLTRFAYFSNEIKQSVRVDKEYNHYILTIPVQKEYWEDDAIINQLAYLKVMLNAALNKPCTVRLIHYELTGDTETLDL